MCKEIKNTDDRCTNEKVQGFHVVAVTNRTLSKRPYLEQIRKICEWGPDAIILREKDLTEKEYKDLAEKVLAICKEYQVPCILHTFYQVAMELPCDGLHLPLPLLREVTAGKSASGQWREKFAKLGTSVHSVEEAIFTLQTAKKGYRREDCSFYEKSVKLWIFLYMESVE